VDDGPYPPIDPESERFFANGAHLYNSKQHRKPRKRDRHRRKKHPMTQPVNDFKAAPTESMRPMKQPVTSFKPALCIVGAALAMVAMQHYAKPSARPTVNSVSTTAAPTVLPPRASYRTLVKGPDREHWERAFEEEIVRLVDTTKSIKWKVDGILPNGRTATYANTVGYKKIINGTPVFRVRLAFGGNLSDYDGERSSSMVDITTVKVAFNHLVSDENLDYCTLDLKDMYLQSKLDRPEFMRMPLAQIPMNLRVKLGMAHLPEHTMILWQVDQALYGMPQAGMLAQRDLDGILRAGGFYTTPTTPCLYKHRTRTIIFTVWVDDFFVIYKRNDRTDVDYLMSVLSTKYEFKTDWTGSNYLGLHLEYDRSKRELTISLPGFIMRMLAELGITKGGHDPGSPIVYTAPRYHAGPQLEAIDESPKLDKADIHFVQSVVGRLLFFGRMVAPAIELAVNRIGSVQANATSTVLKAVHRLLQYCAHHPDHTITYRPSNMQLVIHSDGSHLSESYSRSRAAGVFYFGDPIFRGPDDEQQLQAMQGPVATLCAIIPTVCQAANECEYACCYMTAQIGEHIRNTAEAFGHPQNATEIIYDNELSGKMANNTCKLRKSKAIAVRYHWLRDRVVQGHFKMVWRPGLHNLADFLSKAHPVHHYRTMEPYFNSAAAKQHLKRLKGNFAATSTRRRRTYNKPRPNRPGYQQ
jgi:hypothetical protein